jgi:hypothetical protein
VSIWLTVSLRAGLAIIPAMISIRVGISVLLVEIGPLSGIAYDPN